MFSVLFHSLYFQKNVDNKSIPNGKHHYYIKEPVPDLHCQEPAPFYQHYLFYNPAKILRALSASASIACWAARAISWKKVTSLDASSSFTALTPALDM